MVNGLDKFFILSADGRFFKLLNIHYSLKNAPYGAFFFILLYIPYPA